MESGARPRRCDASGLGLRRERRERGEARSREDAIAARARRSRWEGSGADGGTGFWTSGRDGAESKGGCLIHSTNLDEDVSAFKFEDSGRGGAAPPPLVVESIDQTIASFPLKKQLDLPQH